MNRMLLVWMLTHLVSCYIGEIAGDNEKISCKSYSHVMCPCGNGGKKIALPIKHCEKINPKSGRRSCDVCNMEYFDESDLCKNFKKCKTCIPGIKHCITCPQGRFGKFCNVELTNRTLEEVKRFHPIFLLTLDSQSRYPLRINRFLRETSTKCKVPDATDNKSVIRCLFYSDYVQCHIQCIWGYAMDKDNTRDITCRFDEDEWKPKRFEACKPYVDCGVKVSSEGVLSCTMNTVTTPPICQINCNSDSLSEGREYVCNIDGSYTPPLPKCAEKQATVNLGARAPHCD